MTFSSVSVSYPVTLVGGGPLSDTLFKVAHSRARHIIAVDGGANHCLELGEEPRIILGDFDSIRPELTNHFTNSKRFHIAEQETTDFEKALLHIEAPLMLAVGFTGGRIDHQLAVFSALTRSEKSCIIIGEEDIIFHAPRSIKLNLEAGDRISLFPMAKAMCESNGLEWPLSDLEFSPSQQASISNRVTNGPVSLTFSKEGMLCILSNQRLDQAISALYATSKVAPN